MKLFSRMTIALLAVAAMFFGASAAPPAGHLISALLHAPPGGGYAQTRQPFKPDVAAVTRVMNALGGQTSVNLFPPPDSLVIADARIIIGSKDILSAGGPQEPAEPLGQRG